MKKLRFKNGLLDGKEYAIPSDFNERRIEVQELSSFKVTGLGAFEITESSVLKVWVYLWGPTISAHPDIRTYYFAGCKGEEDAIHQTEE